MFYPRLITPQLEAELDKPENTVITGMRQVGKTTLLNHLYSLVETPNKVLLDLENPLYRKVFEEKNYDSIWNNLQPFGITNTTRAYIFLDEVQNLPQISSVVKYLSDHWQVKFILTGSSSYYLRNLFPESLAGRKLVFELFPLTFREFLGFKGIDYTSVNNWAQKAVSKNEISYTRLAPYYQEYMEFGGFPKIALEPNQSRKKSLLGEIFTSYFERDAKALADFKDTAKLRDLILLLIPRVGSKIEIAKLSSNLSISRETVYNYLSFLKETYFITLLPKFTSIDRQSAGSKKFFLCDSGIANILGKISAGQLFEQSVFQNLRPLHKLNFFSTASGQEIDFIVNGQIGLETKLSASRQNIFHLKQRAGTLKLSQHYLITQEYSTSPEVIPATDL